MNLLAFYAAHLTNISKPRMNCLFANLLKELTLTLDTSGESDVGTG